MQGRMKRCLLLFLGLGFFNASVIAVVASPNRRCGPVNGKTCPTSNTCTTQGSYDGQYRCVHKELFPLDEYDGMAIALVFFGCALAAGGGIGGGGLLVPIYVLTLNFPTSTCTALSLATISGGSISNLFAYARRYHPNQSIKRPLIDYDAILLFTPPLLAGTMVRET